MMVSGAVRRGWVLWQWDDGGRRRCKGGSTQPAVLLEIVEEVTVAVPSSQTLNPPPSCRNKCLEEEVDGGEWSG